MKIGIKNWVVALAMVMTVGGSLLTTAIPQTVAAADTCSQSFLGIPAWYRGLTVSDTDCNLVTPNGEGTNPTLSNFIWHIVLNIIEDIMILVGFIAAFLIIYGGFQYLISMGYPEANVKARTTILDAVIGLVISIVAVAFVNFVVDGILG